MKKLVSICLVIIVLLGCLWWKIIYPYSQNVVLENAEKEYVPIAQEFVKKNYEVLNEIEAIWSSNQQDQTLLYEVSTRVVQYYISNKWVTVEPPTDELFQLFDALEGIDNSTITIVMTERRFAINVASGGRFDAVIYYTDDWEAHSFSSFDFRHFELGG